MPYRILKNKDGSVKVVSPNGIKAAHTTPAKATKQVRLLNAIEETPNVQPRRH